jgi:hypothetical protein
VKDTYPQLGTNGDINRAADNARQNATKKQNAANPAIITDHIMNKLNSALGEPSSPYPPASASNDPETLSSPPPSTKLERFLSVALADLPPPEQALHCSEHYNEKPYHRRPVKM